MRINHNISSMTATNALFKSNRDMSKSLEKLSTGLRINRSSDDAAGLAISENLRSMVRGAAQAQRNAMDGTSMLQIAEGAANEISDVLQRMRELSIQAANDTLTSTERAYTNQEFTALRSEIDRIANVTNYNGKELISNTSGRFGTSGATSNNIFWIDAGATVGTDSLTISIDTLTVSSLNTNLSTATLTTQSGAANAISSIDAAINSVNSTRANIGAYVNRLEHAINNLLVSETNQSAAESLIRDVDFATESANFSKNQILIQSGTAMLAQANSSSQNVLSLLR
ncbi:MAG: flagellin [Fibrobacterota bacterium]|jgi:flagellin|nr:flagellin [Chitinispirillaceae bacterium]